MARDSGQRFIRRNRPPRVHITYENPANAEEKVEIPFVMGVMSDLSGNTPGLEKEDFAARKFLDVDMDNLDDRMSGIQPGISFRVDNKLADGAGEKLGISLRFNKMAGFRAGGSCAPGAGTRQASGGEAAARQSDPLHGRQGWGGRDVAQVASGPGAYESAEEPRVGERRKRE